ncbi:MAG: AAA family ATPase [Cetobacterium sp.]
MLRKFKVKNFKGFKDEIIFDLSKIEDYEFNQELVEKNVIEKSMIYGSNSSGKSNLGLAIFDIVSHLTDYEKKSDLYEIYTNAESLEEITEFYYEFVFGDRVVKYIYWKKDHENLLKEELYFGDRLMVSYDRLKEEQPVIKISGTETLNKNLKDKKISILKYLKNNTVYSKNTNLAKLFDFVDGMLFFKSVEYNQYIGFTSGNNNLSDIIIEKELVEDFQIFLKNVGINHNLCQIEEAGKKVLGVNYGNKKLPFSKVASTGTKSLWLFYCWMNNPIGLKFLLIDEFDAFYHHKLSEAIIEKLKNMKNIQIILTTHGANLMSNELLRPDCYFILKNGAIKSINEYTEKEIKESNNLEKMYKAGIFDE